MYALEDPGGEAFRAMPPPPKAPENGTKSTYFPIFYENKTTFIKKSVVYFTC